MLAFFTLVVGASCFSRFYPARSVCILVVCCVVRIVVGRLFRQEGKGCVLGEQVFSNSELGTAIFRWYGK